MLTHDRSIDIITSMHSLLRLLLPSLLDIFLVVVFMHSLTPIEGYDTWWHLRAGQDIISSLNIPHQDHYSYTASGRPWVAHEWLAEAVFAGIYSKGGLPLLIFLKALIITGTFGLLGTILLRKGASILATLGLLSIALFSSVPFWTVRPHIFTFLFFALYLFVLERYRQLPNNPKILSLLLLPLVMTFWVNLHGGFVIGLVTVLIYLIGGYLSFWLKNKKEGCSGKGIKIASYGAGRGLLIITFLVLGVSILNPQGIKIFFFVFKTITTKVFINYIVEWQAPNLQNWLGYRIFIFVCIILMALRSKKIDPSLGLLFLVTLHFSFTSVRNIPFFMFTATLVIADLWLIPSRKMIRLNQEGFENKAPLAEKVRSRLRYFSSNLTQVTLLCNRHLLLVIFLLVTGLIYSRYPELACGGLDLGSGVKEKIYPIEAVKFIRKEGLSGRLFHPYHWGGYLIFRLYPEHKVFIDGRADMYGEQFFVEYQKLYSCRKDWRETFEKYEIKFALLSKDTPLNFVLKEASDWELIFSDQKSVIYSKRSNPSATKAPSGDSS
ncbi:MAG: hypothetical protein QME81_17195 [bacterium]|nr:hypothetical protein [bacterium]